MHIYSLTARDQLFNVASERGELLVAKVRLLLTSTLRLIPISSLLFDLLPGRFVETSRA